MALATARGLLMPMPMPGMDTSLPPFCGYSYPGYSYGKRSADSEADAWYGYGGLYGYGLPAYGGYGYGLWGKKKRSADAEAKPEADAWLGYGGLYGYGLGLWGKKKRSA